jgi:hypothetical protein
MIEIGLPANCVNHNIKLAEYQRDLCQTLEEYQPSLLLKIQLWLEETYFRLSMSEWKVSMDAIGIALLDSQDMYYNVSLQKK